VTLLTESLHASLQKDFPQPADGTAPLLSAHCLCLFGTATNIIANASAFGDQTKAKAEGGDAKAKAALEMLHKIGITPDQMAARLYEGIKRGIFPRHGDVGGAPEAPQGGQGCHAEGKMGWACHHFEDPGLQALRRVQTKEDHLSPRRRG